MQIRVSSPWQPLKVPLRKFVFAPDAPGKLEGVRPLHPKALIHPIEHGASKLPQDRAQCASYVGRVELFLQELGQEVKIPNIRFCFIAALPELENGLITCSEL